MEAAARVPGLSKFHLVDDVFGTDDQSVMAAREERSEVRPSGHVPHVSGTGHRLGRFDGQPAELTCGAAPCLACTRCHAGGLATRPSPYQASEAAQ